MFRSFFYFSVATLVFGYGATMVSAQSEGVGMQAQRQSYIPLIGITLVPEPFALPKGPGGVTFHYAVKNFLKEAPLTDVYVVDDVCSTIKFDEGDDNGDQKLDYTETWRFSCTTKVATTTQSTATVVGTANNLTATHDAYALVVVGSDVPPPLVSIINITKVAYPLSLPSEGGSITFTYKVNNPGVVPLSDVVVSDEKCADMSNKLGDRNNNNLLDTTEVWIYTCKSILTKTTTNTVKVTAAASGLVAKSSATITVVVDIPETATSSEPNPSLPSTGEGSSIKIMIWSILGATLFLLSLYYIFTRLKPKAKLSKKRG